jgi:2-C-methyl-D-erythritol 4-phosphate cytidylyltransferase
MSGTTDEPGVGGTTDEVGVGADDVGAPAAVGVVPTDGRGSMPFALLHGESLVAAASWALGEAGVDLLDFNEPWTAVRRMGAALVVHDPLCPATPVPFLRSAVDAAREGHVVVGVRPVTDTIKRMDAGFVGSTVDRDSLVAVTSPVVLPPGVVAELPDWPDLDDLAALVTWLRERFPVAFVEAPSLGRRVEDEEAVRLLEAIEQELR